MMTPISMYKSILGKIDNCAYKIGKKIEHCFRKPIFSRLLFLP